MTQKDALVPMEDAAVFSKVEKFWPTKRLYSFNVCVCVSLFMYVTPEQFKKLAASTSRKGNVCWW